MHEAKFWRDCFLDIGGWMTCEIIQPLFALQNVGSSWLLALAVRTHRELPIPLQLIPTAQAISFAHYRNYYVHFLRKTNLVVLTVMAFALARKFCNEAYGNLELRTSA